MFFTNLLSNFISWFTGIISNFNIPSIPENFITSFHSFTDLIFDNLSLLGLFFRIPSLKIFASVAIVLINFKHIYELGSLIYRKVFNRS